MINPNAIQFGVGKSVRPGTTVYTATLTHYSEATVDQNYSCQPLEETIRLQLKEAIWYHIYGDLITPFAELADIADMNAVSLDDVKKAQEAIAKVNSLLYFPK